MIWKGLRGPERRPREGGGPFSFFKNGVPAFAGTTVFLALLAASASANDTLPSPLEGAAGDAARGKAIVLNRQVGLCLLCHSGPFPEERFQGDLAPNLAGVGARLSEGQIRLRIVDASRVNPQTIMPAYYRTEGLTRVAPSQRGKTVLSAQQIEDVVAFLVTLK